MLWSKDSKSVKNSKELSLGNMSILGDIKVLEDWFEMDSHGLDSLLVLIQNLVNSGAKLWVSAQVLSSCKESIVLGDWSNDSCWCLINSSDSESLVDVGHKLSVFEETLRVCSAVLVGNRLELIVSQVVVELGKDGFELSAGNSSLSELIEVTEVLLDTDSSLDDGGTKSVLNVLWIVESFNSWLAKSIVDNVDLIVFFME